MHGEERQSLPNQRAGGMNQAERCSESESPLPFADGERGPRGRDLAQVPQESVAELDLNPESPDS